MADLRVGVARRTLPILNARGRSHVAPYSVSSRWILPDAPRLALGGCGAAGGQPPCVQAMELQSTADEQ
eukprot:233947-Pleurochrysis_carterae.AAC.1